MTNTQILLTIRRLFRAGDANLDSEGMLLLIRLIVQKADEESVYLSQDTIAQETRCSVSTIRTRTQILKHLGIIAVKSGKRRNAPNHITVILNKLPQGDLKVVTVSSAAKQMAFNYKNALLKVNPKRRFEGGSLQRWEYVMEGLLKKCGGDFALLSHILTFALNSPKYTRAAQRGPHKIRSCWRSLFADYAKAVKQ